MSGTVLDTRKTTVNKINKAFPLLKHSSVHMHVFTIHTV